jgi:predicted nucleic acid-binding Zn ribbon protein
MAEPRRIGEIVRPRLDRLVGSDEARAFTAWRQAAGPQVAAATQPIRFARGTLTVVCESSVWTNELTYLGGSLLEKLREADPETPVTALRFVTGRAVRGQEKGRPAAK